MGAARLTQLTELLGIESGKRIKVLATARGGSPRWFLVDHAVRCAPDKRVTAAAVRRGYTMRTATIT